MSAAAMFFAIVGVVVAAVLCLALYADRRFKRENSQSMFEMIVSGVAIAALLVVASFGSAVLA